MRSAGTNNRQSELHAETDVNDVVAELSIGREVLDSIGFLAEIVVAIFETAEYVVGEGVIDTRTNRPAIQRLARVAESVLILLFVAV